MGGDGSLWMSGRVGTYGFAKDNFVGNWVGDDTEEVEDAGVL